MNLTKKFDFLNNVGGYGSYQRKLLFLLIPSALTFTLGVSSMGYIMPAVICKFGLSKYQQAFIYSAIYFGMVPCGIFWGIISDIIGRKRTLIISSMIASIFEFLSAFSFNFWFLFFCKFFSGCAIAGTHLAYYIYMSEYSDVKGKDAMTIRSGGIAAIGYFLLPVIAAFTIPLHSDLSWRIFLIIVSLSPILSTFLSIFIFNETPKFLLVKNKSEECIKILQKIYEKNTGKSPESFPVRNVYIKENGTEDGENSEDRGKEDLEKTIIRQVKPLFTYPYLVPAITAFLAQALTMGAYNSLRQYQSTLFTLAFGIGQDKNISTHSMEPMNTAFCILFESQNLFKTKVQCNQSEIKLDPLIYYFSAIVGFCTFASFIPGRMLINKIGKVRLFVLVHLLSGVIIAVFPFGTAYYALIILCIYSICMQLALTIAIGLIIGRVPTTMRGITVSLTMVIGRFGVILGNQILPVITSLSCEFGFWTIAFLNFLIIPVIYIYSKQPNPLEDQALKTITTTD